MRSIPRIIHQIWFQGEQHIPAKLQPYHQSCRNHNKDYQIIVWDDQKIRSLMDHLIGQQSSLEWIKTTYESYERMIQKIDFAKYVILYVYGGVYLDMDIKCLRALDDLPGIEDSEAIFSAMPPVMLFTAGLTLIGEPPADRLINNGTLLIKPRHPIMMATLEEARARQINKPLARYVNEGLYVFMTTGPICLTKSIDRYLSTRPDMSETIKIIPNDYFEACDAVQFHAGCVPPSYAIGLHVYENSWVSPANKFGLELYIWIMRYWWALLLVLCGLAFGWWRLAR